MAKLKYDSAAHRAKVAEYRRLVDSGKGWCCEVICLVEQDGGTRWIPPHSPMDAAHDRTDPSGRSYLGPAHRRCNRAEGARFKHQRDAKRAAAPVRRRVLDGSNVPTGSKVPPEDPSVFLEGPGSHCRPGVDIPPSSKVRPQDTPIGSAWHLPAMRRVVVIYGPPGAGKSTMAASMGLPVLDLDDWPGTARSFRLAIERLADDSTAQAVVIRCDPFAGTSQLCDATENLVLDTPLDVCVQRIRARGRTTPPIRSQIAAATEWWRRWNESGRQLAPLGEKRRRAL